MQYKGMDVKELQFHNLPFSVFLSKKRVKLCRTVKDICYFVKKTLLRHNIQEAAICFYELFCFMVDTQIQGNGLKLQKPCQKVLVAWLELLQCASRRSYYCTGLCRGLHYTWLLFPTGMFMFSTGLPACLWSFHSQLKISGCVIIVASDEKIGL